MAVSYYHSFPLVPEITWSRKAIPTPLFGGRGWKGGKEWRRVERETREDVRSVDSYTEKKDVSGRVPLRSIVTR